MLVQQIFSIIEEINRRGTTILLVEQNAQQALRLADRAYVLETGRIVRSAPASELLDDPQVRAAYLGGDVGGGPVEAAGEDGAVAPAESAPGEPGSGSGSGEAKAGGAPAAGEPDGAEAPDGK
jgi:branched-chain amino acid transport system ATP-binding protein